MFVILPRRKSDSPSRFREGPVTRLCGNIVEKTEKPKVQQDEADDDSSRESEKQENNDNSENEDVSKLLQFIYFHLFFFVNNNPCKNYVFFSFIL